MDRSKSINCVDIQKCSPVTHWILIRSFHADGTAVDPASQLEGVTHVYVENGIKYFAVLNLTDIQEDKNSYFKIQLLEGNNKQR